MVTLRRIADAAELSRANDTGLTAHVHDLGGGHRDDAPRMPSHPAAGVNQTRGPGRPSDGSLSLTIRCLGGFSIHSRGIAVDLRVVRPIAVTVLRLLAVNAGAPVHRDVILDALWRELREPAALHNLHVAISSLRGVLDSVAPQASRLLLARQGKSYILGPGSEQLTDLQHFDAHLTQATACRRAGDPGSEERALRDVVAWYRGPVLPEDGSADWVLEIRDRYRVLAAAAAARLANLLLARARPAAAAAAATESLRIDPLRDASWRTLIAAHEQAGQPAEAARARQRYAAVLNSLGVTTTTAGRTSGPGAAQSSPPPTPRHPPLAEHPPIKTA